MLTAVLTGDVAPDAIGAISLGVEGLGVGEGLGSGDDILPVADIGLIGAWTKELFLLDVVEFTLVVLTVVWTGDVVELKIPGFWVCTIGFGAWMVAFTACPIAFSDGFWVCSTGFAACTTGFGACTTGFGAGTTGFGACTTGFGACTVALTACPTDFSDGFGCCCGTLGNGEVLGDGNGEVLGDGNGEVLGEVLGDVLGDVLVIPAALSFLSCK